MEAPPAPPPGTNFLAVIRPSLDDILIGHTFTIILIPLLIALFYFSSRASRRHPIFILNVITIMLALAVGGLLDARAYRAILFPSNPPPLSWNIAIGVLGAVQSILVDTILLLRLVAVYPKSYLGPSRFYLLITLPIILKALRIANLIAFIKALADATKDPKTANLLIGEIWENKPYLKIEWFSQLFDNSYASGLFLLRLGIRNRSQAKIDSRNSDSSFTQKIKGLMYIAVSNFVFPVLFSLVQIIIVFQEVNLVVVNDVVLVNTSIAVIGVVFATVWAGSGHRNDRRLQTSGRTPEDPSDGTPAKQELSAMMFQSRQASSHGAASRNQGEIWSAGSVLEEGRESASSVNQAEK